MKEKLLALRQTKFAGVDNAILDRIATKKSENVTDEAQLPTIAEGIGFQDVLTSNGDYRAGDAQQTAVKNYEKRHNLKDGKPIEQPATGERQANTTPSSEEPEWFKAYKRQQEERENAVKAKYDALEAARVKAERDSLLRTAAKAANINESALDDILNLASAMSEENPDEAKLKEKFAALQTRFVAAGLEGQETAFPFSTSEAQSKEEAKMWAENLPDAK